MVRRAAFLEYDWSDGKSAPQPGRIADESRKNVKKRPSTCTGATREKTPKAVPYCSQTLSPQGSGFPPVKKRKSRSRISTCASRKKSSTRTLFWHLARHTAHELPPTERA